MCVVSNIGDRYRDMFPERHPWALPYVNPEPWWVPTKGPTEEEFNALKKEVEELRKLLKAAKKFDEATGQPHCEQEEKIAFIKRLADYVGVDLKDVLK